MVAQGGKFGVRLGDQPDQDLVQVGPGTPVLVVAGQG
jgi:hypothetical protein